MDMPHTDNDTPPPPTDPVTAPVVTDHRTATVPVPEDRRQPIQDDGKDPRWFLPDSLVITYAQEYADTNGDEPISAWTAVAVASGALLGGGAAGKRRTSRTYRDTPDRVGPAFPEWIGHYVDKYHPAKRA